MSQPSSSAGGGKKGGKGGKGGEEKKDQAKPASDSKIDVELIIATMESLDLSKPESISAETQPMLKAAANIASRAAAGWTPVEQPNGGKGKQRKVETGPADFDHDLVAFLLHVRGSPNWQEQFRAEVAASEARAKGAEDLSRAVDQKKSADLRKAEVVKKTKFPPLAVARLRKHSNLDPRPGSFRRGVIEAQMGADNGGNPFIDWKLDDKQYGQTGESDKSWHFQHGFRQVCMPCRASRIPCDHRGPRCGSCEEMKRDCTWVLAQEERKFCRFGINCEQVHEQYMLFAKRKLGMPIPEWTDVEWAWPEVCGKAVGDRNKPPPLGCARPFREATANDKGFPNGYRTKWAPVWMIRPFRPDLLPVLDHIEAWWVEERKRRASANEDAKAPVKQPAVKANVKRNDPVAPAAPTQPPPPPRTQRSPPSPQLVPPAGAPPGEQQLREVPTMFRDKYRTVAEYRSVEGEFAYLVALWDQAAQERRAAARQATTTDGPPMVHKVLRQSQPAAILGEACGVAQTSVRECEKKQ